VVIVSVSLLHEGDTAKNVPYGHAAPRSIIVILPAEALLASKAVLFRSRGQFLIIQ
jgi:hypothetical protein